MSPKYIEVEKERQFQLLKLQQEEQNLEMEWKRLEIGNREDGIPGPSIRKKLKEEGAVEEQNVWEKPSPVIAKQEENSGAYGPAGKGKEKQLSQQNGKS